MGSLPVKPTEPPPEEVVKPTVDRTRASSCLGSSTSSEVIGAASTCRIRVAFTAVGTPVVGSPFVTCSTLPPVGCRGNPGSGDGGSGAVVALRTAAANGGAVGDDRDGVAFDRQPAGIGRVLRDRQTHPGHPRGVGAGQVVPVKQRHLRGHLDLSAQVQ